MEAAVEVVVEVGTKENRRVEEGLGEEGRKEGEEGEVFTSGSGREEGNLRA